ncbi:MAG TPA: TolC family protein, partial [Tepidisphaeraceae bacterium]|nr:TolC family protein [Tepidisphaeraceae bacterium]
MLLLAASCKVGPDYHPPSQAMPASWESPPTTRASVPVQAPVAVDHWWATFDDPMLNSLVERALASNLTLEAATERIRGSRAAIGIVSAGLWPGVNGTADYARAGGGSSKWGSQWRAGLD